jgi:hypothetical protein
LVPGYLPYIPVTGIPVYPEYEYKASSSTSPNKWELSVSTGYGMNFDSFLYLPEQNYPEKGYGGVLKPMAGWAYVYE